MFVLLGPSNPFDVDAPALYTELVKQILQLAQAAEEKGYTSSKVNILEQCERLVHHVEARKVAGEYIYSGRF